MPLVVVVFAAFVVSATGVHAPQLPKSGTLLSRARSADAGLSATRNDTLSRTRSSRPPSCIQNTGVSCLSQGCDSSQECNLGQCYCSSACSSGDGVCHKETNLLVASGLRLRNAQWPTYYLVASTLDNYIHVDANREGPLTRFNLYRLPGQGQSSKYFLLVPQGSPSHSVGVVHRHHCSGIAEKEHPLEKMDEDQVNATTGSSHCRHTWKAETQPMSPSFSVHPSVQDIAVQFSQAPAGAQAGAITIRGSGKDISRFMFVHKGSYKVSARPDDPGLGGYWIPDPPLSFSLPAYDGPPCKHDCGSLSVRSAMAGSGLLLALLVALLV